MNCSQIQEMLSAYFDGELDLAKQRPIAKHLKQCSRCATQLAGYSKLAKLANELPVPIAPKDGWSELAPLLDAPTTPATHVAASKPTFMSKPRALALAATILIVVGAGWFGYRMWAPEHMHTAMLGHYIEEFQRDPAAAQQLLLAQYPSEAVVAEMVVQRVGYRPAVADGMPRGYAIESTFVMEMPCCTCVQTLCKRTDGSTLVVFEHNDENAKWLGKRSSTMASCAGKSCCITKLDSQIAATWKRGKRHMTLIGAKDVQEVEQIVAWLDQRESPKAS